MRAQPKGLTARAVRGTPGGRAAIRRTELLWRNEASDTVAGDGESSSPRGEIDG
jgi:hypothetical protein